MAKTVEEFLKPSKEKPKSMTLFLDDKVMHNPTKICPGCESANIELLHTHNLDVYDYKCNDCQLRYEICLFRKYEDLGH